MVNGLRIKGQAPFAQILPTPVAMVSNNTVYILRFEIQQMIMPDNDSQHTSSPISQHSSGVLGAFTTLVDARSVGEHWLDKQEVKHVPDPSEADPDPLHHWTRADWKGNRDPFSAVLMDIHGTNRMIVRIETHRLQYLMPDDSIDIDTQQDEGGYEGGDEDQESSGNDENIDERCRVEGKAVDDIHHEEETQTPGSRKRAREGNEYVEFGNKGCKKARMGSKAMTQAQSNGQSGPKTSEHEGPAFHTRSEAKTPESEGPAFRTRYRGTKKQ